MDVKDLMVSFAKTMRVAFASELSRLGSNLGPAINCHPSVSQAGRFIYVCAVPSMDVPSIVIQVLYSRMVVPVFSAGFLVAILEYV